MGSASDLVQRWERWSHIEQLRRVEASLEQMPVRYREVIACRNLERQLSAEIARKLNRSEKSTQRLWSRVVQALQKLLNSTL
jgi:DNA-directed RNA polymerase specialized sigma24 family protein